MSSWRARKASMGSAAQDRACRTGERIVGAATAGKRAWVRSHMEAFRASGLDYPRATVFAVAPEVRIEPAGDRALSYDFPGFRIEIPAGRPELKVLPVKLPVAVPIGIVTLKNRTLSPVAQLFIEHAREVAKPLAKGKCRRHVGWWPENRQIDMHHASAAASLK